MRSVVLIFCVVSFCACGPVFGQTKVDFDGVEVEFLSAAVQKVRLTGGGLSREPVLRIELRINNNRDSAIRYRGWALQGGEAFSEMAGHVQTPLGGWLRAIVFDQTEPIGQVHNEEIPPGESLTDVLVYASPGPFKQLKLTLPGRTVGVTADFILSVPVSDPPPEVKEPPKPAAPSAPKKAEPKPNPVPKPTSREPVDEEPREPGGSSTGGAGAAGGILAGLGLMMLTAILFGVAAYFFPLVVALFRSHHNAASIAVINIFLGWTFLGWVVALAMAFSAVDPPPTRGRRSRRDDDDDLY